jgi:acyl-CoA synthetase (AMP-forming)/AMP-acid ligase II
MQHMLLGNILKKNAHDPGLHNKPAVICGERTYTYGELNEKTNRLAHILIDQGLTRGERVAVLGRNSATYVALYFALAKVGAVIVPVNFWYKSQEIHYTLQQSQSCALIADGCFAAVAAPALKDLPELRWTLYYDTRPDTDDLFLDDLIDSASAAEPQIEVGEDDLHIILYTSGTTGFPKGATFTHKSHYLHALSLAAATGGHQNDVGALIYPLFHTGGPDCLVLPHFLMGATLVILDGGDTQEIIAATQRHGITNIYCVPTVWRRLLAALAASGGDVSTVKRCLGSSDTFPPDLLDEILQRFDADVYVTYGLTEAGCILTVCKLTAADRSKLGSVGRPMSTVELRLLDDSGQAVLNGEVGQVAGRTPAMMRSYWNMPERTAESLRNGWLYSGDLGRLDEDGYLFLAGRAKDMIISGGENIYPLEIERLLKEDPRIRDVAIIGVPDREWGESLLAAVVKAPGAEITADEIIQFVRQRLAGYKKPKYVEFIDALPLTAATGKVQKAVLRQRYAQKYGTA